jgi:hypothetical protein
MRALAPEVRLSNGSLSNVTTVSKLFRLPKRLHFGLGVLKNVPQGLEALSVSHMVFTARLKPCPSFAQAVSFTAACEAVPFVRSGSEFYRSL